MNLKSFLLRFGIVIPNFKRHNIINYVCKNLFYETGNDLSVMFLQGVHKRPKLYTSVIYRNIYIILVQPRMQSKHKQTNSIFTSHKIFFCSFLT